MNIIPRCKALLQRLCPRSILSRILLIVIAGMILTATFSVAALCQYEYSVTQEANFSLMQAAVDSVSSSTSLILSNSLAQKLYDLSNNATIRDLIYYVEPLDAHINAILTDLNTTSANNIYISAVIFYDSRHNIVLDSKYRHSSSGGEYRDLLAFYNDLSDANAIEYNHEVCDFFSFDNEYYLSTRFVGQQQNCYGNLFFKINTHYLYWAVFQKATYPYNFYVYNENGAPVFPEDIDYSSLGLSEQELKALLSQELSALDNGKYTYSICTSPVTGWIFVSQAETDSLKPQFGTILKALSPVLLLVSIIALLLSVIITYVIYTPLKQAYQSIFRLLPDGNGQQKNELNYITYALSEVNATMKRMENIMDNISADILNRIFTDLLNNVPPKYEYVKTSVQSIRSPFKFDNIYVVSGIQFLNAEDLGSDSEEDSPIQRISSALSAFNTRTDSHSFVKQMGLDTIAVITSFAPTTDIDKAHQVLDNMEVLLTGLLSQMGFHVCYARGHFYHSILDITASYNRALGVLAGKRKETLAAYPSEALPAPEPQPETASTQGLNFQNNDALKYQIAPIINSIESRKSSDAYPVLQDILTDLKQRRPFDSSTLLSLCVFLKAFSEMLESKDLIKEADVMHAGLLIAKSRSNDSSEEDLCSEIETFCVKLLDNAQEQYKVTQNPYLIKAKKYIEAHYSDSSLSLDIIAAECDITPNYLSKLFATSGIYYSEYISQYRITRSITLLRETDMSINEIAEQCGFNSPQSYIRVFKKQLGVTPGSFRK